MGTVAGYFDDLHFTEAWYGKHHVVGRKIVIPVRNVFVTRDYPFLIKNFGPVNGLLIFDGVMRSRRDVSEYAVKEDGSTMERARYVVDDELSGPAASGPSQLYSFEGRLEEFNGWLDWDIEAHSFEFAFDLPS